MDNPEHYRLIRERVNALVATAQPTGSERVPACPEWSLLDLVSHLSGVAADILAGNIAAAGTDPWTDAQVTLRRDQTLAEVLAEWNTNGPTVEALFVDGFEMPDQLVFDTVTHEQDLRGALALPGERDNEAIVVGLQFIVPGLEFTIGALELPSLRLVYGPVDRTIGSEPASATLTLSPFELLRALSGRRTPDEIKRYDWGGANAATWLPAFAIGPFTPCEDSLHENDRPVMDS